MYYKVKNEWELKRLGLKKYRPKIKPFHTLARSTIEENICNVMFLRTENENFDISLILGAHQNTS